MEPTPAQSAKLSYLRRAFGAKLIKPHSPNRATGVMRVEVTCEAGVWEWFFDTNGILVDSALVGRLFDMPPPTPKPRSAVDN